MDEEGANDVLMALWEDGRINIRSHITLEDVKDLRKFLAASQRTTGARPHEFRVMLMEGTQSYTGGNTGWVADLENGLTAYNIAMICIRKAGQYYSSFLLTYNRD